MADFRFRPPPYEIRPEEEWVLRAAFCGGRAERLEQEAAAAALAAARRLGLSSRIANHLGRSGLQSRLDISSTEAFLHDRYRTVASNTLLSELCQLVAATAAGIDVPLVLLKGVALLQAGHVEPGGREIGDVDILVPGESATSLVTALCRGELEVAGHEEAHHLPPLAHPRLGVVEIHSAMPGVRLGAQEGITARRLLEAGECRQLDALEGVWVPREALLAAHAVAHALDQHSFSPALYPLLRLFADLTDLSPAEGGLVERAGPYLTRRITPRELTAVEELRRRLQGGDLGSETDDAVLLLRHVLVGATSERYRRRLLARSVLRALSRGDWRRLWRRLRQQTAQRGRSL